MRVTAIQSFKDGVLKTYGDGELLEDKVPNAEPFKTIEVTNPCIKLDDGGYVWGFQCWWGAVEKVAKKFESRATEVIKVKPDVVIEPVK